MKFNPLKTRIGKLENKIKVALAKPNPDIKEIIFAVEDFEQDNIDTIEKLKKVRQYESKKISGAIKQCIGSHGPITKLLIGSATKRIVGACMEPTVSHVTPRKEHVKEVIGMILKYGIVAFLVIYFLMTVK